MGGAALALGGGGPGCGLLAPPADSSDRVYYSQRAMRLPPQPGSGRLISRYEPEPGAGTEAVFPSLFGDEPILTVVPVPTE